MSPDGDNIYESLERIFHEPNRLAIMSALCASADGLTFGKLKEECRLTDGNLSRHLKVLEESDAITIKKSFVGVKPQTTVFLSGKGRQNFLDYLMALEEVLKKAAKAARSDSKPARSAGLLRPSRSKS